MGDIQTLLADPEFATLSPAGQRALAGRLDPELGSLSDAAFKSFLDKVSHPVTPGMEKLGGVPPGPVAPELPGRLKQYPGWDRVPGASDNMTRLQMAGQFLATPVTGLLHAPGEVIDWFKRGGHNAGPSGGFLTEEPISMAYGNALAAAAPKIAEIGESGLEVAKRLNSPAGRTALINVLPKGREINTFRNILFPPPEEAPTPTAPKAPDPFRPNQALARRMPFGGPGPEASNPPGANIPRGRYTPPAAAEPAAPKAPDPFKPNPATARKMPFGGPAPDPFSSGKPVGPTGWEAPTEPLYPAPSEPPPTEPFQRFQVKQGVKDRMRGGARGGMTPGERGGHVPARRTSGPRQMPTPPKGAAEGATESNGVILTPAMQEALVQAELAKRGLPSKMTPMPKGSPGEAPAPGSTVLPPKANLPPHYGALRARVGDVGTDNAYAKDLKIANRLKSQGITPEQWEAMDTATRNAHVKAADPKFREYKEGPQKGFGRSAEEGFGHIAETLRGLYR